jgi:hypothetical protein
VHPRLMTTEQGLRWPTPPTGERTTRAESTRNDVGRALAALIKLGRTLEEFLGGLLRNAEPAAREVIRHEGRAAAQYRRKGKIRKKNPQVFPAGPGRTKRERPGLQRRTDGRGGHRHGYSSDVSTAGQAQGVVLARIPHPFKQRKGWGTPLWFISR